MKVQDCALIRLMIALNQETGPTTTLTVSTQTFSRPGGPTREEGSFASVTLRDTIDLLHNC